MVRFGNLLRRPICLAEIVSRIDELDRGAAQIDCSDYGGRIARQLDR